jgi:catechol 2,3-dioxygenase-like lactoylglutathione lyase family enzyme
VSTALAIPTLPARDLSEAVAFYAALGFVCSFRQDAPDGYAIVRHADGREVHLFLHTTVDPLANYAGCYWRVADVEAVHRSAIAAGLPVPSEPSDRVWRMREFHLVDPSGNLIRIGQPAAPAPSPAPAG